MANNKSQTIAVIGAGIAGSTCAHALASAGHAVQVFDKSRGPGGRLATRRVEWTDRAGRAWTTRFDHGAIGFTARTEAFRRFVEQALQDGCLAEWVPQLAPVLAPVLAPGSLPAEAAGQLYVPAPDMPALSRRLLNRAGLTVNAPFAVDGLHQDALGWQVQAAGERHPWHFDAVVLALPPAQAATLLGPHRRDWARHAALSPMQPCWTLMGIADNPAAHPPSANAPARELDWDLARPPAGPLACVLRNDSRPGRQRVSGQAHWVVHARAGWSRRHLEQPATWVASQMQAALADCLGRPVDWHHCVVHRWRYASAPARGAAPDDLCWWDAAQGLGVCGDFLGGSGGSGGAGVCGVEAAWLSAQSLVAAVLQRTSAVSAVANPFADHLAARGELPHLAVNSGTSATPSAMHSAAATTSHAASRRAIA